MLKILIHNFIALQFFCSSTGVVSTLKAQFEFWVKSPLKMHCTKNFLDIKDITNFNTQIYSTKNFLYLNGCGLYPDLKSPLKIHFTKHFLDIKDVTNGNTGVASTLTADFGFWVKSPLKIHFTKKIFRDKRCYKS